MTITPTQFRLDFPEFSDQTVYPDSGLNYWINLAYLLLPANRWRNVLDVGAELFAAHNLTLEAQAQVAAAKGHPAGTIVGALASQSVSKVSVSYDTSTGIDPSAGHWKLTTFGLRFFELMRMAGAGGLYVAPNGIQGALNGPAWNGPFTGYN